MDEGKEGTRRKGREKEAGFTEREVRGSRN
jgi:hypothetical protein